MALRTDRLTIPQGTSWEVRWPILNSSGVPADLTGWSPRAQARVKVTAAEILHEWSVALATIAIIDSAVAMMVTPETSSAWDWRSAVFDVELAHTDGRVIRITQGFIKVDPEVTR